MTLLIKWTLLLQEFDVDIKDRKGSESLVAVCLSKIFIEYTDDLVEFSDHFSDEQLFAMSHALSLGFSHCELPCHCEDSSLLV